MIAMLVVAVALLQTVPVPDTAEVYTVVLQEVRNDYPALPVVLAESRSGVACMPHCGADLRDAGQTALPERLEADPMTHSPALLARLRERGVVQATCVVEPASFGCAGHPGHLFVGLGTIQRAPPGGPPAVQDAFWVKAALLAPSAADGGDDGCGVPDALGWWFLVTPTERGEWRIVRRLPAFAI